jgi:hypothetical protein
VFACLCSWVKGPLVRVEWWCGCCQSAMDVWQCGVLCFNGTARVLTLKVLKKKWGSLVEDDVR